MDPNANLQEQERLLPQRSKTREERERLRELRAALWEWLLKRGFEPEWHKCPRATRHFRSFGGSIGPEHYT